MEIQTWPNRFVNCHEPLVGGGLLTSMSVLNDVYVEWMKCEGFEVER